MSAVTQCSSVCVWPVSFHTRRPHGASRMRRESQVASLLRLNDAPSRTWTTFSLSTHLLMDTAVLTLGFGCCDGCRCERGCASVTWMCKCPSPAFLLPFLRKHTVCGVMCFRPGFFISLRSHSPVLLFVHSSCLFTTGWRAAAQTHRSLLFHFPFEGCLGHFRFLVIVNNAAIDTCIQVSLWTSAFVSLG